MRKSTKAELFLLLVAVLWGLTFPLIHEAMLHINASVFVTVRFAMAALVFLPIIIKELRQTKAKILGYGALLGVLNSMAYFCQTKGLVTISPARSAFITGISVLLVPFLSPLFKLSKPKINDLYCALLCLTGLYILTGADVSHFSQGDILTLLGALATATSICLIQKISKQTTRILLFVFYQIVFTIPLPLLATQPADYAPLFNIVTIIAILFCAIFATTLVFYLQLRFQRDTSATRAAIIYALEPVFATIFSYWIVQEPITVNTLIGGGLIFLSIIMNDLYQVFKKYYSSPD